MNAKLVARYPFQEPEMIGKDSSGNGMHAIPEGTKQPAIQEIHGKKGAYFCGGSNGTSYMRLPEDMFQTINDGNGITIATWIHLEKNGSAWERICDFGQSAAGPYLFFTRSLQGVCFAGTDLAARPSVIIPTEEWVHVALVISGTKAGSMGSAGPVVYLNGEMIADGRISQTSSGLYKKLQEWFATLSQKGQYNNCYLGRSQFAADPDFAGYLSDFRVYEGTLSQNEIMEQMCESYTDEEMVALVEKNYLQKPRCLAVNDYELAQEYLGGRVKVIWSSSDESVLTSGGIVGDVNQVTQVTLTATLVRGKVNRSHQYSITVLPKSEIPYKITVHGDDVTMPVSDTLWGLFYEDINNSADGGIYAEQIQNRSFENFEFEVYDSRSGENGKSSGRKRKPLEYWFGNLEGCTPHFEGGLQEQFGIAKPDTNNCYISVASGVTLENRGFCDTNHAYSIITEEGMSFAWTIWVRAKAAGTIVAYFKDTEGKTVSNVVELPIHPTTDFEKYGVEQPCILTAKEKAHCAFVMEFAGDMDIDFVSLMPQDVWGAQEEEGSPTAHSNYRNNPNYRLRKDLVVALKELHPSFLRFPGGCISEGSYLWENVYDWKDSVGPVEHRRENYNVWGYVMTMGLGYMEYFQLAEDLGASPLPVMACGVLCQARSDYANPAGGALQEKYISNFLDLIDFAISTDYEHNVWAQCRKEMGHEKPFDLHLLGIGNENWGEEFMASFEIFYERVRQHMDRYYPGYPLTIVSTVGAQADDDAYRFGWKFLEGKHQGMQQGKSQVWFTDGETSYPEEITWYQHQADYMDTIADEHYYRPSHYLIENTDRYEFYERVYHADGTIDDAKSSKVFVGEYASTEKNSLSGAVAEAAIMTGFENNTDVVRLAATAPLFNKVLTDNQYRWTPDCIWFDQEKVWFTPTYYVQKMFAENIGKEVVSTDLEAYEDGMKQKITRHGGISLTTTHGQVMLKEVLVTDTENNVLLEQDFTKPLQSGWGYMVDGILYEDIQNCPFVQTKEGILIDALDVTETGLVYLAKDWERYIVKVKMVKIAGEEGFYLGAGVTDMTKDKKNALQYAIGMERDTTGILVFKQGSEAYRKGDFSSSICAGNMRSAVQEAFVANEEHEITFDFGYTNEKKFSCQFQTADFVSKKLTYRLLPYHREMFSSATKDDQYVYVKLVNTDDFDKKCEVVLTDLPVKGQVTVTSLSAEMKYTHMENVNTKQEEVVKPVTVTKEAINGSLVVEMKAQSVAVIRFQHEAGWTA